MAEFDESLLKDVGFDSEELDEIFDLAVDEVETFDLEKELKKLDINKITVQKGDVYQLGDSRLMCGDSTIEADFDKLMNGEQADMCMTDPPYILDYLHAKRGGKPVTGFGAKRNEDTSKLMCFRIILLSYGWPMLPNMQNQITPLLCMRTGRT